MLKKVKIFVGYLFVQLLLCNLMGCSSNMYNVELFDDAVGWIREDFIQNNLTSGAFYNDVQISDSYPDSRVFLIRSSEEGLKCLNRNFDIEVDYEQEMLIVYTWTTEYHRDYKIEKIEVTKDTLYVNCKLEPAGIGVGDASMPFQRWLIIKLDLLPISSVLVELT